MKKWVHLVAFTTLAISTSVFASNNDEDTNISPTKHLPFPMRTGFNLIQETPEQSFRRRYNPVVEELNQLPQEEVQNRIDRFMNFLHTVPTDGAILHVPQDIFREVPVKYINAADFRTDDDPLNLSLKYLKLALIINAKMHPILLERLNNEETAKNAKNRLMAILFIKSGYKMSQVAKTAEPQQKADYFLSTAQLYHWASYRLSFSPLAQKQWLDKAGYYAQLGMKALAYSEPKFVEGIIKKMVSLLPKPLSK